MKYLWRLLTAISWIAVSCGLLAAGWLLSGGRFDSVLAVLAAYVALAGLAYGTGKGIVTMIQYSRAQNGEKTE